MVIDGDGWHRGVIGITATRVVERWGRPTLVISKNGDEAHGSGRSIKAFHLLNALESCSSLFTRFGGHAHAVGFSLPSSNLPELRAHLGKYARGCLCLADFDPVLSVDAELPFDQITPNLFHALKRLEPFGMGNPEPVFSAHNVRMMTPVRVMKEKHVKLRLGAALESTNGELLEAAVQATPRCHPDSAELPRRNGSWKKSISYNALGWRLAERFEQAKLLPGDNLDIAFTLDHNDHPDFGGLELSLKDFKAEVSKTARASEENVVPESEKAAST
jgi:single-stranded-DNA-specific exonuclease